MRTEGILGASGINQRRQAIIFRLGGVVFLTKASVDRFHHGLIWDFFHHFRLGTAFVFTF
jgi:hypothetical protein